MIPISVRQNNLPKFTISYSSLAPSAPSSPRRFIKVSKYCIRELRIPYSLKKTDFPLYVLLLAAPFPLLRSYFAFYFENAFERRAYYNSSHQIYFAYSARLIAYSNLCLLRECSHPINFKLCFISTLLAFSDSFNFGRNIRNRIRILGIAPLCHRDAACYSREYFHHFT